MRLFCLHGQTVGFAPNYVEEQQAPLSVVGLSSRCPQASILKPEECVSNPKRGVKRRFSAILLQQYIAFLDG
jgi:hypothetical protein